MKLMDSEQIWTFNFDEIFPGGAEEAMAFVQKFEGQVNIGIPTIINGKSWAEMYARDTKTVTKLNEHFTARNINPDFRKRTPENLPSEWSANSSSLH